MTVRGWRGLGLVAGLAAGLAARPGLAGEDFPPLPAEAVRPSPSSPARDPQAMPAQYQYPQYPYGYAATPAPQVQTFAYAPAVAAPAPAPMPMPMLPTKGMPGAGGAMWGHPGMMPAHAHGHGQGLFGHGAILGGAANGGHLGGANWAGACPPGLGGLPGGYSGEEIPIPGGALGGAAAHAYGHFQDKMCGYAHLFAQPPHGFVVNELIAMQRAKAAGHKFTLYRSDFIAGTAKLSPSGAGRLNQMAAKLPTWLGPLIIEWVPEAPALGEQRKYSVANLLAGAGLAVTPERIAVGPVAAPGMYGTQADSAHQSLMQRYDSAPDAFAPGANLSTTVQQISGGGGS